MTRRHKTPAVPLAIDVFAGAGGLSEGLRLAGFKVVAAIEIDDLAAETYSMNHPQAAMFVRDVREVNGKKLLNELGLKVGELDLLAGCPPCQGFSSMRTLNGKLAIEDARNDLVFEFVRLIGELRPKSVMLENVPGLHKDVRMREVISELQSLGYYSGEDCARIVNAKHYGVPQNRRRLVLMTSIYGPIPFAKPSKHVTTVGTCLRQLDKKLRRHDPLHHYSERRTSAVSKVIRQIPSNGGSRRNLPLEFQLNCHKRMGDGFKDVYGRMSFDQPAPTITGGCISPSKGRFLHPVEHRAITLREAACLQSFRHTYKFSLRRGRQGAALLIGNALPPILISRHANCIIKMLASTS